MKTKRSSIIFACIALTTLMSGCTNAFVTEGEETQIIGWGRIRKGTHKEATSFGTSTNDTAIKSLFAPTGGESK